MGFGQEMKDFLSAYQAGEKIAGAPDDRAYKQAMTKYQLSLAQKQEDENNDEEGDKLDKDAKRAQIRLANARANNIGKTPQDPNGAVYGAIQPYKAAPDDSAAFTAPSTGVTQVPQGVPGTMPAVGGAYSAGGAVKKFADGGAVDNDGDENSADDDADGDGAPAAPAVGGTSSTTDISSRRLGTPAGPGYSIAAGLDAVKAGANYGATVNNIHRPAGLQTSETQAGAHAWAHGTHAAPALDMEKLGNAVDPEHKMSDSDRNMAAMGAVYQFKMKQGDTDGAARSAYQMLQYYRNASSRYAALAAVAAQKGDLDTATHAAMKAYANIPDGKNFQVVKTPDGKLSYTMTDMSTGKVTQQGVEPPEKLASAAMGLAGPGFDQQLISAINQTPYTPPTAPAAVAPKPMKVSDKTSLMKQINKSYETQNPDVPDPNDSSKTVPKYSPDDQTMHKGAAMRIAMHPSNDGTTPDEATQVATKIADPTIADKGGFSPKQVDGGVEVTFGKRKTFVPQDDFDSLLAKRTELMDAKKAKDEKAKADAKDSGSTLKGAIDLGATAWDKLKSWNAKENDRAKADIAAPKPAVPTDYSQPQP